MLNIIVKEVTIEEYYKIINGNDIEILKDEKALFWGGKFLYVDTIFLIS